MPSSCSHQELLDQLAVIPSSILPDVFLQCGLVVPKADAVGMSQQIQDVIGWGGVPVEYPNDREITTGAAVAIAVTSIFLALVVVGTALDWLRESKQRLVE